MDYNLICSGELCLSDNSQIENTIAKIRKRNGKVTAFDKNKIVNAINKALSAVNQGDLKLAENLTSGVVTNLLFKDSPAKTLQAWKIFRIW